jgi:hypothetical protein
MVKELSYLDPGTVLKDSHDEAAHALRIRDANSRVPSEYSKVVFDKAGNGSITKAVFYRGSQAEKTRIKFFGDVANSLNGKYFLINAAEDVVQFYVWYNSGTAVDPALPGKVGIEIPFVINDPATLIRQATYLYFFKNCEYFDTQTNGTDVLLIENKINGETSNSSDVDTGFGITTIHEGITQRICSIVLPLDASIRYLFNEAERRFELFADQTVTIPGLTVSAGSVANLTAVLANTEYSFTLAANVRSYEFSARGNSLIKWSFAIGTSGTVYKTEFPGNSYKKENLNLATPLTIYFQTSKPNEVLEIITFS